MPISTPCSKAAKRLGRREDVYKRQFEALGGKFGGGQFGQHVRGVDQGFLGGLADAGFGFLDEGVEDEPGGEANDQEVTEEEADGDVHRDLRRRCCSRARDG